MAARVKVRIAVAVDPKGEWCASGWSGMDPSNAHSMIVDTLESGERHYWVEALLDIPTIEAVEGMVNTTTETPDGR